jgi:predicted DNA-binding transcriptional regulator YafY
MLATVQLKVLPSLSPELATRANRAARRFHLDAPGWFQPPEDLPHVAVLGDAVWSELRVGLSYRHRERVVRRSVEPLGLVIKAGM